MSTEPLGNPGSDLGTIHAVRYIWTDILKKNEIGDDESFFDLGGDSMDAMLCISRLRKTFQVEFTIEDFFVMPATIRLFARLIDEVQNQRKEGD
jgi:acyl carrier protein